jgi:hypothetical protein
VRTVLARIFVFLWIVASSAILARLWLARPDLGPQVPPLVSLWLVEQYGSTNGEELRDLEVLIAFGAAFTVVLFLTLLGLLLWRRCKNGAG